MATWISRTSTRSSTRLARPDDPSTPDAHVTLIGCTRLSSIPAPSSRVSSAIFCCSFPGSTVTAPKDREYPYDVNDPDDGHVAHAAIIGKADAIVTDDRRAGFRTSPVLLDADIETVSPVEFAANTVAAHPKAGVKALQAIPSRHDVTPAAILDDLRDRYKMADVDEILRRLI